MTIKTYDYNNVQCYGNVRLIRPYEFNKYVKYIKLVNVCLALFIPLLYPLPLSMYLNKYIKIKVPVRW